MTSTISRESFFDIVNKLEGQYPKSSKLDIGSGGVRLGWTTIDKSRNGEDYSGDIRTLFASVYNRKPDKGFKKLPNRFDLVRMQHIVEHIEWIYQKPLFDWLYSKLSIDGCVFIETPNVDWVIDSYLSSNDYSNEHPDIKEDDPCRLIKWLNFKLYSGCSTNKFTDGCTDGDFHLCMYNQELLEQVLTENGFSVKAMATGETLLCLATK